MSMNKFYYSFYVFQYFNIVLTAHEIFCIIFSIFMIHHQNVININNNFQISIIHKELNKMIIPYLKMLI